MSDKSNNLNKNDENIQFDKVVNSDQKKSDTPSVNLGTAPLKQLSPIQPRISALSDKSSDKPIDSSENAVEDKPATPKLSDRFSDKPIDSSGNAVEDKPTTPKLSDRFSDKPIDSSENAVEDKPATPKFSIRFNNKPVDSSESAIEDKPATPKFSIRLNNKSADSSESVVEDKSATSKLSDPSEDKPLDTAQSIIDEKPKLKSADNLDVETVLDLPFDDTSIISKLSDKSKELPLDVVKPDTDNTPKSSDSSDKSSEVQFKSMGDDENDKPITYANRSTFDNLQNRASILTFRNKKDEKPPQKNPDTAILPEQSPSWRKVIEGQAQGTTGTIGEQREVLFVIRGMIERVVMKDNTSATLGRFDTGTVPNEEIDLIPYGAVDRGVSRRHCKIILRDNQLHVIDLDSTNGTFLAGVRLNPNEATVLRKGDELLLGRLAVQILFR